mgnify:CR=1 FL=1
MLRLTMLLPFAFLLASCATNDDATEIAELKSKIEQLESELDSLRTERDQIQIACAKDSTSASTEEQLTFKVEGVDDELLDWYFNLPSVDPDINHGLITDEDVEPYVEKLLENPEQFITLAAAGFDNPYLFVAINYELPESKHDLVLPYVQDHPEFANIGFDLALHEEHSELFEQALFGWQGGIDTLPSGLVMAALEAENPAANYIIEDYAVHGSEDRLAVFEAISDSSTSSVNNLANDVWNLHDKDAPFFRQFETAFIAAKYAGNINALQMLARLSQEAQGTERSRAVEHLLSNLVTSLDVRVFHQHASSLEYNSGTKRWFKPNS